MSNGFFDNFFETMTESMKSPEVVDNERVEISDASWTVYTQIAWDIVNMASGYLGKRDAIDLAKQVVRVRATLGLDYHPAEDDEE